MTYERKTPPPGRTATGQDWIASGIDAATLAYPKTAANALHWLLAKAKPEGFAPVYAEPFRRLVAVLRQDGVSIREWPCPKTGRTFYRLAEEGGA